MRLVSLLVGAGFMYFFDPSNGIRRRQWLREQFSSISPMVTSVRNMVRSSGDEEVQEHLYPDTEMLNADWDSALVARVAEVLQQHVTSPASIRSKIKDGVVTLTGSALLAEIALVMEGVNNLPGVTQIENRIKVRQPTSDHLEDQPASDNESVLEVDISQDSQ